MSNSKFENISTQDLESSIHDWQNALEKSEADIAVYQERIDEGQTELNSRKLAVYWRAHPDELPLAIGNMLQITQGYNESYKRTHGTSSFYVGDLVEIETVEIETDGTLSVYVRGRYSVTINGADMIHEMRRVYLSENANK